MTPTTVTSQWKWQGVSYIGPNKGKVLLSGGAKSEKRSNSTPKNPSEEKSDVNLKSELKNVLRGLNKALSSQGPYDAKVAWESIYAD